MTPRTVAGLDRVAYHAAAGLVANGAAALAAGGVDAARQGRGPDATAAAMLGPLLRSVAENVERSASPRRSPGPVRRGDAAGVGKHLETLERIAPELRCRSTWRRRARSSRWRGRIGDAPAASFDAIEERLGRG